MIDNIEYFEELLILDESSLDASCKTQAELFRMVGNNLVNAIDKRDRLEHELDVLSARKDEIIRRKATDTNEKITENAIKNRIIMDVSVIEKNNALLDAQREVNDWSNLQNSYIQRVKMIEELSNFIRNQTYGELVIKKEDRKNTIEFYQKLKRNKNGK